MNIIKPDYNWSGNLSERSSTDFFLVHHAYWKNCTVSDIHNLHVSKGWTGIGYNWFIAKSGLVYEGRPEWASDADAHGYNYNSLSVCLEGDFTQEKMGEKQRKSLIRLMDYVQKKYPKIKLLRHLDVNHTSCPGEIGWVKILADVQELKLVDKKTKYATVEEVESLRRTIKRMEQALEDNNIRPKRSTRKG